ncbi:Ig-like domain-containing protein [Flavobacterium aciduliphilum]|uniref:Ig-like domain-containing protein n=1 Tax=Flavobacterium aciduliphilum TaxID=1101402 RepID=A0A328YRC2_9FLAO|nr:Ig-like domain-containing protein [Flavobacterium aciduliphilum]RAR72636.1 Ig-like domain-containing protein [Flavobacterium aciduliphilum]
MQKLALKYSLFIILLGLVSCAKKGTISGGAKDTIAPKIISSIPKNFSKNVTAKEIKITFDEYVKLKDLNKQLIVSPPMKQQPDVLPYTASKTVTIKIKDTLQPNTTYSFNFGNSIQDNNEGNAYQQFKYVFSTGNTLDSLQLGVKVKDAREKNVDNFVSIMLYEVDNNYSDSLVYKQAPRYITNTLDSIKIAKIENIKAGKYKLIALKDKNGNNKYDPKLDKIGFIKDFITIPNDTVYELELFKEAVPFKALNVSQATKNKFTIGYEGNSKEVKIDVKKNGVSLPFLVTKFPQKDSLQVWCHVVKGDSLKIDVSKKAFHKTYDVAVRDLKKDSIGFSADYTTTLHYRDTYAIRSNTPLTKWDVTKIKLLRKDSTAVKFDVAYDEYYQKLRFLFEKEPLQKYKLKLLKGALTDFNDKTNDSLSFSFNTNNISDYGNLKIVLENVKRFPILVELTNAKGEIKAREYSESSNIINFEALEPYKYTLRVIYDDNKDTFWTPGNFMEQKQSEEVYYFPKEIDVRGNWDVEQPINLSN